MEFEESYWEQKSRVRWLKEGDKNTAFVHTCTVQRRQRNKIVGLEDAQGIWQENKVDVQKTILEYFQNIFSSSKPIDFEPILACVEKKVLDDMNVCLTKMPSNEVIKAFVFQMDPSKAHGPDGPESDEYGETAANQLM
ncbi:hypothetical protein F0562_025763 [Nyssa sinensis]|uniref:Reverse transcriptase domain-containing protein n=1 Tax=Nyssa sinensis TaxID=561372 RepID=A0A5J5BCY7_9ASTE|nr:hypothetical protein F0562_025763 [Nyssa sinensis]